VEDRIIIWNYSISIDEATCKYEISLKRLARDKRFSRFCSTVSD